MPRIRTIKPEFFSHEILASKSAHARLLAIGLLTLADCDGRLRWVPMQVHSQVFPWEASVKIEVLLGELVDASYVVHYEVDGKRYVEVLNFRKHQRLSGKEAAYKSRFPAPPKNLQIPSENHSETWEVPKCFPAASLGSGRNPLGTGEHRNIGTGEHRNIGTGEHRNIGTGEQGKGREQKTLTLSPLFAKVVDYWNSRMLQTCRGTHKRQMAFVVRAKDSWWVENWQTAIDAAADSKFCRGENDKGWIADLEWFLKPDSAAKLVEGKYANRESQPRAAPVTFAQQRELNSKTAKEEAIEDMRRIIENAG